MQQTAFNNQVCITVFFKGIKTFHFFGGGDPCVCNQGLEHQDKPKAGP